MLFKLFLHLQTTSPRRYCIVNFRKKPFFLFHDHPPPQTHVFVRIKCDVPSQALRYGSFICRHNMGEKTENRNVIQQTHSNTLNIRSPPNTETDSSAIKHGSKQTRYCYSNLMFFVPFLLLFGSLFVHTYPNERKYGFSFPLRPIPTPSPGVAL